MSSCGSSGEDYMGRRLRQLQQDYNQRKYVGWDTEEEIAARKVEMERSVRKEVKIVTAQQEGGPSNPIMVGLLGPPSCWAVTVLTSFLTERSISTFLAAISSSVAHP